MFRSRVFSARFFEASYFGKEHSFAPAYRSVIDLGAGQRHGARTLDAGQRSNSIDLDHGQRR